VAVNGGRRKEGGGDGGENRNGPPAGLGGLEGGKKP